MSNILSIIKNENFLEQRWSLNFFWKIQNRIRSYTATENIKMFNAVKWLKTIENKYTRILL
jgi:hypothetical protein